MKMIEAFIKKLSEAKVSNDTNNLYKNEHCKANLSIYLNAMLRLNPEILLVGEAPGHKGCGVTGIPFTSEKVLKENIFFKNHGYFFNSERPQTESSATIVWGQLNDFKTKPLIWNIYPFHPHKTGNVKSNRTPNQDELKFGAEILIELIKIFEINQIYAIGRKAVEQLKAIGKKAIYVRHPSKGGKKDFIDGIKNIKSKYQ